MSNEEIKLAHINKQLIATMKVIIVLNEIKEKDEECKKRLFVLKEDADDLNIKKQALELSIQKI